MKLKKLLSVLLTLALLAGLLPLAALTAAAVEVGTWDALAEAVAAGGDVVLTADVAATKAAIIVRSGTTVTVDLAGHTLDGTDAYYNIPGSDENAGCVFFVVAGGSLTLRDSVGGGGITGGGVGVLVMDGSFTMEGGEIGGQQYTLEEDGIYDGIGVCLYGGSFTMTGGSITSTLGVAGADAAVALSDDGSITGGYFGVYLQGNSAFTMSGGEISGQQVYRIGNDAEPVFGNGVMLYDDTSFTMSGGVIRDCAADGVYLAGGSLEMTDGWICKNDCDGVYAVGSDVALRLLGGDIRGNKNFGVLLRGGATLRIGTDDPAPGMDGACLITGNAGGVSVEDSACYMYDGDICGNLQFGVNVEGDEGLFALYGGYIFENGDGVQVADGGSFEMHGGAICGNSTGVYVMNATFTAEGDAVGIYDNAVGAVVRGAGELMLSGKLWLSGDGSCDLLLPADGAHLTVTGPLEFLSPVRVGFEDLGGAPVTVTSGLADNGDVREFVSAADGWYVSDVDGEAVLTPMGSVSDWEALAAALAAGKGVMLDADLTAPEGATALTVPAGKSAALDLNGKTLDSSAVSAEKAGVTVSGSLTLSDSSAVNTPDEQTSGTGFFVSATIGFDVPEGGVVTMTQGTVTATLGGAEVVSGGEFYLYDGKIADAMIGVVVEDGGAFCLLGGEITGSGMFGVIARGTDESGENDSILLLTGGRICDSGCTGVVISDGGQFLMEGGEICHNGFRSGEPNPDGNSYADGVLVDGGSFEMYGGEIDANRENGVVVDGGSFEMYGGWISDHAGYTIESDQDGFFGGTGVLVLSGDAAMYDGIIADCFCGVYIQSGSFEMSGGAIVRCGNTDWISGGVYVWGSEESEALPDFLMTGGEICDCYGDGVIVGNGTFTMTGGYIWSNGVDCPAEEGNSYADGVCVEEGGSFVLSGEGLISENRENGVVVDGGSFLMAGGRIDDHTGCFDEETGDLCGGYGVVVTDGAALLSGGEIADNLCGVLLTGGSFEMTGGEICGNVVFDEDDYGYGIFVDAGAAALYAGDIHGNDLGAALIGGTLTLFGDDAAETLLCFADNEYGDVGLADGNTVDIGKVPNVEDGAKISLNALPRPAAGTSVVLTSGLADTGFAAEDLFTSAVTGYTVGTNAAGEAVLINDEPAPYYDDPAPAPEKKDETKGDETPAVTFTDVAEDAWYAGAAAFAEKTNLFEGVVAEGEQVAFEPNAEMDRGEAIRVLWNLAGKPAPASADSFGDVPGGSFYADAAAWAAEVGVTNGTGEGFDPTAPITREQFATMVYRFLQLSGKGFTGMWAFRLDFPDAENVSDWAYEGMCWLVMNGVINGMDGLLNPQGVLTRAQTAALLQRVAEALEA